MVQTYSVTVPRFVLVDFLSLYLQVPMFFIFYFGWKLWRGSKTVDLKTVDIQADQYKADSETQAFLDEEEAHRQARIHGNRGWWITFLILQLQLIVFIYERSTSNITMAYGRLVPPSSLLDEIRKDRTWTTS